MTIHIDNYDLLTHPSTQGTVSNEHFILARMKWIHFTLDRMSISFWQELNDHFILDRMKCHFIDTLKKYVSRSPEQKMSIKQILHSYVFPFVHGYA